MDEDPRFIRAGTFDFDRYVTRNVGGVELPFGSNEYGMEITASYTLPNEGVQDYVDIEEFPRDAR